MRHARIRIAESLIAVFLQEGIGARGFVARPIRPLRDVVILSALIPTSCVRSVELLISSPDLDDVPEGEDAPLVEVRFEQIKNEAVGA